MKTILELAAFDLSRTNEDAKDEIEGQREESIVSSRIEMWAAGVKTENERLMPIIQAQEERIKALREALFGECMCVRISPLIEQCPPCAALAADTAAEAKMLEGAK